MQRKPIFCSDYINDECNIKKTSLGPSKPEIDEQIKFSNTKTTGPRELRKSISGDGEKFWIFGGIEGNLEGRDKKITAERSDGERNKVLDLSRSPEYNKTIRVLQR
jgi:hypothetical protein